MPKVEDTLFTPAHLKACRDRYAETADAVFETMIQRARRLNLDPLSDIWQAPDGTFLLYAHAMFAYAAGTGRYLPGTRPVEFTRCGVSPSNPHGLETCTVTIRVRAEDGAWFECPGEAYWDDLVPVTNARFDPATGTFVGGTVSSVSGWATMPRTMLRKCAYADALRRAFPELGSFAVREERDREIAQQQQDARLPPADPTGGVAVGERVYFIPVDWLDGEQEQVGEREFFERVSAFLSGEIEDGHPERVEEWFRLNKLGLDEFYIRDHRLSKRRNAVALKRFLSTARTAVVAKGMDPTADSEPETISPQERRSAERGLADARAGRFASPDEVDAAFRRFRTPEDEDGLT